MATSVIEIKIRTILEGLQGLASLEASLRNLSDVLRGVGNAGSGDALKEVSDQASETTEALNDSTDSINAVDEALKNIDPAKGKFQDLVDQLNDLGDALGGVTEASGETEEASEDLGGGIGGLIGRFRELISGADLSGFSLSDLMGNLGGASRAVGVLFRVLGPLIGALLAMAAIKISFDYLIDAAKYAARLDTLGVTLGVVAENAGYTKEEIEEFEKALKKQGITTDAARTSMIAMINAGVSLGVQAGQTKSQVELLARAAQDLAVITGEDSSSTFARLVDNIQQLDAQGLRWMGVIVNLQNAYEKFGDSINKNAEALTHSQKVQAAANATLEAARGFAGTYEASLLTIGKKLGSLTRIQLEFKESLGNMTLGGYGELVVGATELLIKLKDVNQRYEEQGDISKNLQVGMKGFMDGLSAMMVVVYSKGIKLFEGLTYGFSAIGSAVGVLFQALVTIVTVLDDVLNISDALVMVLVGAGLAIAAVATGFMVVAGVVEYLASGVSTLAAWFLDLASILTKPFFGQFSRDAKAQADEFRKMAGEYERSGDSLFKTIADGEDPFNKMWDNVTGVTEEVNNASTAFDVWREKVRALTREQTDQTKNSTEIVAKIKEYSDELTNNSTALGLNRKQVDILISRLAMLEGKEVDKYTEALKGLGTTMGEIATGVGEKAGIVSGSLLAMVENGIGSITAFSIEFSRAMDMTKSIEELNAFSRVLEQAKTQWPESMDELLIQQEKVKTKFLELASIQISKITDPAQWNRLKQAMEAMAKDGRISIDDLNRAIAEGVEKVRTLSPAYTEAARAATALGQVAGRVAEDIKLIEEVMEVSGTRSVESFKRMAEGYSKLSDLAKQSFDNQIIELDRWYQRETSLDEVRQQSKALTEKQAFDRFLHYQGERYKITKQYVDEDLRNLAGREQAIRNAAVAELQIITTNEEEIRKQRALGQDTRSQAAYMEDLRKLEVARVRTTEQVEVDIKAARVAAMKDHQDRYRRYIDDLIAEERRLLGEIKSIEEEKKYAQMDLEDKLLQMRQRTMTEQERYISNNKEVLDSVDKMMAAFKAGNKDDAAYYLRQANSALSELGRGVEGYITQEKALQHEMKLTTYVVESHVRGLDFLNSGKERRVKAIQGEIEGNTELNKSMAEVGNAHYDLRQELEDDIKSSIDFEYDEAMKALELLKELSARREILIEAKVEVGEAISLLSSMMEAIKRGEKMEIDTSKAVAALKVLAEEAKKTGDTALLADVRTAMAALGDQIKSTATDMSALGAEANKPISTEVKVDSNAGEVLGKQKEIQKFDGTVTNTRLENTNNLDEVIPKLFRITEADGSETFSDHYVRTNADQTIEYLNEIGDWTKVPLTQDLQVASNLPEIKEEAKELDKVVEEAKPEIEFKSTIDANLSEDDIKAAEAEITARLNKQYSAKYGVKLGVEDGAIEEFKAEVRDGVEESPTEIALDFTVGTLKGTTEWAEKWVLGVADSFEATVNAIPFLPDFGPMKAGLDALRIPRDLFSDALEGLKEGTKELEGIVKELDSPFKAGFDELNTELEKLDGLQAAVTINTPNLPQVNRDLEKDRKANLYVTVHELGGRGRASGGLAGYPLIQGLVSGPGTETSDSIPHMLSRGEYVVRAQAVREWGLDFLEHINRGKSAHIAKFSEGGPVQLAATGGRAVDLPEVAINLSLNGGQPHRLLSSRAVAKSLSNALRELERGL